MVADPLFWKATYNTLYYTLLAVPIGVVVAMALRDEPEAQGGLDRRSIYYLPSIMPVFAISFIFVVFLNPGYGLLNYLLTTIGLRSPNWLGDPAWTKIALVMIAQLGAGQYALIFTAGLKGPARALQICRDRRRRRSPQVLQHHAATDDAGHPLRPDHRSVTRASIFTPAFILTGGGERAAGPDNSLLTFVYLIYRRAFQFGQMGYAAAVSVVLFVTSMILAVAVFRWARGGSSTRAFDDRRGRHTARRRTSFRTRRRDAPPQTVRPAQGGGPAVRGHLHHPFYWMLISAVKSPEGTRVPPTLIPDTWVWQNFSDAVSFIPFFLFAVNSLIVTLGITIGSVLSNTLIAYGFLTDRLAWARKAVLPVPRHDLPAVPGDVVALFDIFGRLPSFGLEGSDSWVNTFLPLIVPAFFGNPFYIFLMRQFMLGIPRELSDAARVDGASEFEAFWKVILPLTKPAVTVVAMLRRSGLERVPAAAALPARANEVPAGRRSPSSRVSTMSATTC